MKATGIICEYNPFHCGHAWQIQQIRQRLGEERGIVCVMSGNFVQRGDFAIVRKHIRAEAALRSGADLVLELPLLWALSSAEGFARGGVGVLTASGVVDTLAFGSECGDANRLMQIANLLNSTLYQTQMQRFLAQGLSFASCRAALVREFIGESAAEIVAAPNDNLGVEYCRELIRQKAAIAPMALPRQGVMHHGEAEGQFASASYIRSLLLQGDSGLPYMTEDMAVLYAKEQAAGRAPVSLRSCERAVLSRLRSMAEEDFAAYDTGKEGLYHRFYRAVQKTASVEDLLAAVKTKRYAYTRLRRMLLRIFLELPEQKAGEIPYLRVLGVRSERGRALLRGIKNASAVPVLTKPADVRKLSASAQKAFLKEAAATDQYVLGYPQLSQAEAGSEWRWNPVVLA